MPTLALILAGEVQRLKGFPSSLHWKVEPASFEENLNTALVLRVVLTTRLVILV